MDDKTTYTNNLDTSPALNMDALNNAIEMIEKQERRQSRFSKIQCGSIDELCKKLGLKKTKPETIAPTMLGVPVFERGDLPKNEVRLISKDGFYTRFTF